MNNNYIKALEQSHLFINKIECLKGLEASNPIPKISSEQYIRIDSIFDNFKTVFKKIYKSPLEARAECFLACGFASSVLIRMNIEHYITIGDIEYQGKWFSRNPNQFGDLKLDRAMIQHQIENPDIFSSIDAHCWITLENGVVIDPTILVSFAFREDKNISFGKMFYRSDLDRKALIYHPLATGIGYVLTQFSKTGDQKFVEDWLCHYSAFMEDK